MKLRSNRWIVLVPTVAMTLAACGGGQTSKDAGANASANEMHIAWPAQPPTLDPLMTTAVATRDIGSHIFEGLVAYDGEYAVQPMLADSWEVSADNTAYTFTLREGITFHDGSDMTAEDVVASMERWLVNSSVAVQFLSGSAVEAIDEMTVRLTTPTPVSTTLNLLSETAHPMVVMPKEIVAAATAEGVSEFVGTGPYAVSEVVTDQYIKLDRFEDYQSLETESSGLAGAKKAPTQTLFFDIVTDPATRLSGIQTGQYDAANLILPDHLSQVENDPDLTVHIENGGYSGFVFNKAEGMFTDQTLRQAVNTALDLESVELATFTEELFNVNGAMVTEENPQWYTEDGLEEYNRHDMDAAKDLLAASSYDGGAVRILASREYDWVYNSAVVLQQTLEELGMTTSLEVVDWPTYQATRADKSRWDIVPVTAFPFAATPTTHLFFTEKWAGWTDSDALDGALNTVLTAPTQDEKLAATAALQEAIYDYVPAVKTADQSQIEVTQSDVEGFDYLYGPIYYNATAAE